MAISVAGRTETPGTATTTPVVNFTQTTGDRVVIFIGLNDTAQSLTDTGGFTELAAASRAFHVLWKDLDGSEGGSATLGVGTSTKFAAVAYNIQGQDTGIAPAISTVATGTSTAPNPTGVTPAGGSKEYLWLAAFRQNGEEANDDTWCTSAPTNFVNLAQTTTGTGGLPATNGSVASAEYIATASTMDPGAFTTVQSLAWAAFALAIAPQTVTNYQRTTSDSVTSASEAVIATKGIPRSTSETLSSSNETIARSFAGTRSTSETLSSTGESVTRVAGFIRREHRPGDP